MISCPDCRSGNIEKRGFTTGENPKRKFVCKDCNRWFRIDVNYIFEPEWHREPKELKTMLDSNCYIITSAQNNTPIDKKFWGALKNLADLYKAKILVIPLVYKNPTSVKEAEKNVAWWPDEVHGHLLQNEISLATGLRLFANVRVSATAVNPLSGLDTLGKDDSIIIGHGQIQMKTIATPQHSLPKIMHTTGSTSVKNYSQTKAGIKGEFHHSLGALIVEKDKDCFHIRSVVGDDEGEFYDLDIHATEKGTKTGIGVEALVTGDTHVIFHSDEVRDATFDNKHSITKILKPKKIVRHDLIDCHSISFYHKDKPTTQFKKWLEGTNSLERELEETAEFLEDTTPKGCKNIIVASNHNDRIGRWLEAVDPKKEPWNAILYHDLMYQWLTSIRDGEEDFDPFVYWMENNCEADCEFLTRDVPYTIKDILVSLHGDKGANGRPGSVNMASKLGVKTIIGHFHAPAIEKGSYVVGTSSTLNMDYTKSSPSSWLNTHAIIHPNGKRQLINIINGKWHNRRKI